MGYIMAKNKEASEKLKDSRKRKEERERRKKDERDD